ncbi:unnamed protein product [Euphydryas editha]|uniref:THAP-type domain-containing protein n=1 Tax=Euphydryas editha TaxID=104508 RepID=A0AAU9UJG1_EUPED|nr:unnamed protein product [Euphydryas editha]
MPRSCAFGCKPTADVAMHRFPSQEKFPERFKTWVTLCGGKLETSADYYNYNKKRVCDRHFEEKDYNRNKRLNALAVPSLYLAGISQCTDGGSFCQTSPSLQTNTAEVPLFQALEPQMINLATSSSKSINAEVPLSQALEPETIHLVISSSKSINTGLKKSQRFNCAEVSNTRAEIKHIRSEIFRLKNRLKQLYRQLRISSEP